MYVTEPKQPDVQYRDRTDNEDKAKHMERLNQRKQPNGLGNRHREWRALESLCDLNPSHFGFNQA